MEIDGLNQLESTNNNYAVNRNGIECDPNKSSNSLLFDNDEANESQKDTQPLNYQQLILDKLNEISVRIDILEKNQVNAIVERQFSSESATGCQSNATQNFTTLQEQSLPAKSKEDLDKLEFDLVKPELM